MVKAPHDSASNPKRSLRPGGKIDGGGRTDKIRYLCPVSAVRRAFQSLRPRLQDRPDPLWEACERVLQVSHQLWLKKIPSPSAPCGSRPEWSPSSMAIWPSNLSGSSAGPER